MATRQASSIRDKRVELLTLLVTVLGVVFVTLGVHLKPDYSTAALIFTYFAAGVALVVGSYLIVTYTTSGKKRQPIAREIVALTLIFIAWLLTWAATFEVYYMQPRLPSSWTVLPFSYDVTGGFAQLGPQRQAFLAADGSTVILRVTGTENEVQLAAFDARPISTKAYADSHSVSVPPVRYAIEVDDAQISGGPWTFSPESPPLITIPNLAPSSFKDGMHFLSVYPVSGPYKMRLALNCIIEVQKASQ